MNIESFWDIFYVPIGWLLRTCYTLVSNYAVALLFFAIVVKFVLIPFGIKQQRNSIKQSKMYPYEKALIKKYQIDKINKNPQLQSPEEKLRYQKYQAEKAEIYQRIGFNPLSGCLPLLIQLPLIIIIYNVVRNPLRYLCGLGSAVVDKIKEIAGAADEITALRAMRNDFSAYEGIEGLNITHADLPNFNLFDLDLSVVPKEADSNWFLLIPLFTFIAVYFTTKLTRKFTYQPPKEGKNGEGASMKIMTAVMPLMTVFFTYTMPAVIGVYWIYQNLIGVLQQFIMSKAMPIPELTEEEYKAAERVVNGKPASKKKKAPKDPNRPRVRSLHHIDDDEYNAKVVDTAPNTANVNKTASPFITPVQPKDYGPKIKK